MKTTTTTRAATSAARGGSCRLALSNSSVMGTCPALYWAPGLGKLVSGIGHTSLRWDGFDFVSPAKAGSDLLPAAARELTPTAHSNLALRAQLQGIRRKFVFAKHVPTSLLSLRLRSWEFT